MLRKMLIKINVQENKRGIYYNYISIFKNAFATVLGYKYVS